jgi:hypothetical protein
MCVSPTFVGTAVGAAVGTIHAVNISVAEAPLEKVYGPATTASPPVSFKVQDAPFQPSPKLSIMYSVFSPGGSEMVWGLAE